MPAGQLSYAKVVAAQIGQVLGLQSGVDTLYADRSQGVVLHDAAVNTAANDFEDVPYAEDLFRYRSVNGLPTGDAETGDAPTYFIADARTALTPLGTGFNYGDGAGSAFPHGDAGGVFVGTNTVARQSHSPGPTRRF